MDVKVTWFKKPKCTGGRRGRDRMVVVITTTYIIVLITTRRCEFEPRSGEVYSI